MKNFIKIVWICVVVPLAVVIGLSNMKPEEKFAILGPIFGVAIMAKLGFYKAEKNDK